MQLFLYSVEELGRAKKILHGVKLASSLYPHSIVAVAIAGMIMGIYAQNVKLYVECVYTYFVVGVSFNIINI